MIYGNTAVICKTNGETERKEIMTFKKFKKAVCVLAAAAMMLCLSSCMAMETGLVFNEDGTVKVFCDTTVEEEMLSSMDMTKEDFLASINESESSEEYAGFETESVETKVNGKAHVGQRYFKNMTLEELNSYVQDADSGVKVTYSAENKGGELVVTITYTNSGETAAEETSEISEYLAQGMMTTSHSVTAPYDVVETNGVIDAETGKITWDTMDVMIGTKSEAVFTVTYKLPFTFPVVPVIIIAAVVVVAVVVAVILSKKKSTPVPVAAIDFSAQETTAEAEAPAQEAAPAQETAPAEEAAPAEETAEAEAVCKNCGAKLSAEDKFCQGCGEKTE